MSGNVCETCHVELGQWPYLRSVNGICMECHRESGSFFGLMDMLTELTEETATESEKGE